ncbi:ABC transporter ATP-binding protein [Pseudorhodoferax sp. Leaf267]|uniref:ABC transporter ATP-binding protein n=1 Tax=Pseudorhodoferax sp. Leaf267 TaxID=1736316 RepID=UPI0009E84E3D|nr:sn-glycerol-3-phosphate ABC transporter ATP-binding protein UgpC [Pseudorhodoferax sp. Leaf267]
MSAISFRNVHKRYDGASLDTIRNVNLEIQAGEFVVFVGPSGCGKSTLLRMVAGLEDISSGDLSIKGARVNETPPSRRGVAMVFQSYALYPHMTVYDNMAFGLKQLRTDGTTVDQRVRKASKILQLDPLLKRLPKELSGGQRQRVAIGRAIVREPDVFLFDEPLSNLDASLRVQTRLEIAKLHKDIGTASMIYVTHDQVEAMTLADKIVLLNAGEPVQRDGSVAQFGAPLELYHHPVNKFVAGFIGSPKMNFVAAVLSQADARQATVMVGPVPCRADVDASALPRDSEVTLGVRPEHVQIADGQGPNIVTGLVAFLERLGEAGYVYVRLAGGELVTVRQTGHSALAVGSPISLYFPPQDIHVFDGNDVAVKRTADTLTHDQPPMVAGVSISRTSSYAGRH